MHDCLYVIFTAFVIYENHKSFTTKHLVIYISKGVSPKAQKFSHTSSIYETAKVFMHTVILFYSAIIFHAG